MGKNPSSVVVSDFGEFKVIPAVNAQACVDPRPTSPSSAVENSDGGVWSPGASFGLMMSLAGASSEADPRKIVDVVCAWEKSEGRSVVIHEDDHSPEGAWGCGHRDRACVNANEKLYGISTDVVYAMGRYLRVLGESGAVDLKVPILAGRHEERAVLVIESFTKTVVPRNAGGQCFKFDAARHARQLTSLAAFANKNGVPVSEEELVRSSEKQRNATLSFLAEGLPLITLDLTDIP